MILADYFRYPHDDSWDFAKASGFNYGVIRLPDDPNFDFTSYDAIKKIYDDFVSFGITPIIVEPMPNQLWDHVKAGDEKMDECIDIIIKLLENLSKVGIKMVCFNFMAHIGWLRTNTKYELRHAYVTEFDEKDFVKTDKKITEEELWSNYKHFLDRVIPYAEKYDVKLALHPDDPPLAKLGDVSRIMISYQNIKKAIYDIHPSKNLGVTFCQANFHAMGEDIYKIIPELKDKIFFIHFRNIKGTKTKFHETHHDNGEIDMYKAMKLYIENGINVPIRVDHNPTYFNEDAKVSGYGFLGRLFAYGYMVGLIEAVEKENK